jgi:hypothetical protein
LKNDGDWPIGRQDLWRIETDWLSAKPLAAWRIEITERSEISWRARRIEKGKVRSGLAGLELT